MQETKKSTALDPFTWLLQLAWHLMHIAKGKPRFEYLADNVKTVGSFLGLSLISELARIAYTRTDLLISEALVGIAAYWVSVGFLTMKKTRSDSLFCAVLGAGSLVSMVQLMLVAIFEAPAPAVLGFTVELLLAWCAWSQFQKMPKAIQAAGFAPAN